MLDFAKHSASKESRFRPASSSDTKASAPADRYPEVYWLNYQTIAIDWFGRIDEDKCHYALVQMQRLIAERSPRYFFSDTSRATHYVPAVRHGAADILRQLRRAGVIEMAAVLSSPAIRVFASALARITGVPLKTFAVRDDAIRLFTWQQRIDN